MNYSKMAFFKQNGFCANQTVPVQKCDEYTQPNTPDIFVPKANCFLNAYAIFEKKEECNADRVMQVNLPADTFQQPIRHSFYGRNTYDS